jgi:hypothetical protein
MIIDPTIDPTIEPLRPPFPRDHALRLLDALCLKTRCILRQTGAEGIGLDVVFDYSSLEIRHLFAQINATGIWRLFGNAMIYHIYENALYEISRTHCMPCVCTAFQFRDEPKTLSPEAKDRARLGLEEE